MSTDYDRKYRQTIEAHRRYGSTGYPTPTPAGGKKAHLDSSTKQDVLNQAQDLFEQTCHNICLQKFPQAGPKQDYCMKICHHKHPNSDMNDDMDMDDDTN
ncbi:Uu.00g030020.m01.CDS01 [Anthostomella pinea]|uniref:Uu.00g030020.m01.CDS01 n=1 Tax=Anthostomella pinea TaxID=933095 RepID=A0AAI8V878_9PEZI|nr:Uu.00g030020.m01.CDS01 [Anthostomella pinea]